MIEWIASAAVLLGIYLYGQKGSGGPIVSIVACFLWGFIGSSAGMLGMVVLNLVLMLLHLRNLLKME